MSNQEYPCSEQGKDTMAVLIVGYGKQPQTGKQYFIIQNYFGTDWGIDGYARVSAHPNLKKDGTLDKRRPFGTCGILKFAAVPVIY